MIARVGAFAAVLFWARGENAGRFLLAGTLLGIACLFTGIALSSPGRTQAYGLLPDVSGGREPRMPQGRVPEARMLGGVVAPEEVVAVVRHAGFAPRSRPLLRGAVYVVFATDRYLMDVRLTIDARSGRVIAATRLAGATYGAPFYEGVDAVPRTPPRANSPPYEAPEGRAMPAARPSLGTTEQAKRAVGSPPPRSRPEQNATAPSKPAGPALDDASSPLETAHIPSSPGDIGEISSPQTPQQSAEAPRAPHDDAIAPPALQQPIMAPVVPLE
jgi:hypothetical protein